MDHHSDSNSNSNSNSNSFGNRGGESSVRVNDDTLQPLGQEIHAHSDMALLPQRSNLTSPSLSMGYNVPLPQFCVTESNSVGPYGNTLLPSSSTAVPMAPLDMSMAMRTDLVSVNGNAEQPTKAPRWSNTDELTSQNSRQVFNPNQITTPFDEKMEDEDSGPINNGSTLLGVKRRAGKEICSSSDGQEDTIVIGGQKYTLSELNSIVDKQRKITETLREKTSSVISADGKNQLRISGTSLTACQMKQLECEPKLYRMAKSDPKRVKKIMGNRVAVLRIREKKEQQVLELRNKTETLQAENTEMSNQISHLQSVHTQLEKENKELKDRLQFQLEHQGQRGDDDTKGLTAEVKRLKMVETGEVSQYPREAADSLNMQPQNGTTSQQQLNVNDTLREIERTLLSDPNPDPDTDYHIEFNLDFQFDF